jgi:hypothetical protein
MTRASGTGATFLCCGVLKIKFVLAFRANLVAPHALKGAYLSGLAVHLYLAVGNVEDDLIGKLALAVRHTPAAIKLLRPIELSLCAWEDAKTGDKSADLYDVPQHDDASLVLATNV